VKQIKEVFVGRGEGVVCRGKKTPILLSLAEGKGGVSQNKRRGCRSKGFVLKKCGRLSVVSSTLQERWWLKLKRGAICCFSGGDTWWRKRTINSRLRWEERGRVEAYSTKKGSLATQQGSGLREDPSRDISLSKKTEGLPSENSVGIRVFLGRPFQKRGLLRFTEKKHKEHFL